MKTRTQPGEEWPVPRGHDKPSRARWCDEMTPVGTDADAWLARAGEELLEAAEMLQDFAEYAERMRELGRGYAPISASGFEAPDLVRGLLAVRAALGEGPEYADRARCPDCGEEGERKGHMGCQYPAD